MRGKGKKPKITCPERMAFLCHRHGAVKVRGIAFHFTYEDWVAWWKYHLGPNWFELRGRCTGQYVMARRGDKGPYARWNVKCITHSENSREQHKGRGKRLTPEQVVEIYLSDKTKKILATQFNVSIDAIINIRRRVTWGAVTGQLLYTGTRGILKK